MNSYASLCDDFGITTYLTSKLELPTGRETVLGLFDAVKKRYPTMTDFEKRDANEFALEEPRESGNYRWVTIDGRRLSSGYVNPPSLETADEQNEQVLEMAEYHLSCGPLDTDYLDVQYYFDLDFAGNHDEVVAEALGAEGPFENFTKQPGSKVINFQPSVMMALDDTGHLQARLTVETRTTLYHVRTGNFPELPISTYLTIRQFWHKQPHANFAESYRKQREKLDELVNEYLLSKIVQPMQQIISAKS